MQIALNVVMNGYTGQTLFKNAFWSVDFSRTSSYSASKVEREEQ